jgi:hypothetical protein
VEYTRIPIEHVGAHQPRLKVVGTDAMPFITVGQAAEKTGTGGADSGAEGSGTDSCTLKARTPHKFRPWHEVVEEPEELLVQGFFELRVPSPPPAAPGEEDVPSQLSYNGWTFYSPKMVHFLGEANWEPPAGVAADDPVLWKQKLNTLSKFMQAAGPYLAPLLKR